MADDDEDTTSAALDERLLLEVEDLKVHFRTKRGDVRAVDGVSFDVAQGRDARDRRRVRLRQDGALPLDHGPAATARTCIRSGRVALRRPRHHEPVPQARAATLRGTDIAMVFQDPMTSLNPVMRIGRQITEGMRPTST